MKTITGLFLVSAAAWMALAYGWTYAMTEHRFPVEGYIGAFVPLMCVIMGFLGTLVMSIAKDD